MKAKTDPGRGLSQTPMQSGTPSIRKPWKRNHTSPSGWTAIAPLEARAFSQRGERGGDFGTGLRSLRRAPPPHHLERFNPGTGMSWFTLCAKARSTTTSKFVEVARERV